eukprot:SAG25_NODE_13227_length_270_cov_0.309942_1_plen_23_part_01
MQYEITATVIDTGHKALCPVSLS